MSTPILITAATNPDSSWPFNRDRQEAELPALRAAAVSEAAGRDHPITEFTCDRCRDRLVCDFVFDGYNTDGDCIA